MITYDQRPRCDRSPQINQAPDLHRSRLFPIHCPGHCYEPGGRRFESCRARHSLREWLAPAVSSSPPARFARRTGGRVLQGAPTIRNAFGKPFDPISSRTRSIRQNASTGAWHTAWLTFRVAPRVAISSRKRIASNLTRRVMPPTGTADRSTTLAALEFMVSRSRYAPALLLVE